MAAARRLELFGENVITKVQESFCAKLITTLFMEPMPIIVWIAILIEAIAAGVEWPGEKATSALIDVFVLLALQFLNAFVGLYEELSAKKKIEDVQAEIALHTSLPPLNQAIPGSTA